MKFGFSAPVRFHMSTGGEKDRRFLNKCSVYQKRLSRAVLRKGE
jgi:hypothetical protein